jgi:hypothetical protein
MAHTQLQRDYDQACTHLAFLERCAALPRDQRPTGILLATTDMIAVARQKVQVLAQQLVETARPMEQLPLFPDEQHGNPWQRTD